MNTEIWKEYQPKKKDILREFKRRIYEQIIDKMQEGFGLESLSELIYDFKFTPILEQAKADRDLIVLKCSSVFTPIEGRFLADIFEANDREAAQAYLDEFNKLKSDKKRWKWVRKNQDSGIVIILASRGTWGQIKTNESGVFNFVFDYNLGCDKGVEKLLKSIGIKYKFY